MSDLPTILIDVGSRTMKAGLNTEDLPSCVFSTCIGKYRHPCMNSSEEVPYFIAEELLENQSQLSLSYPVDHGHIEEWEQLELLFQYIFNKGLQTDPQGRRVLISEPPFASSHHRSTMVESMMETYNVAEINLSIQGILALYSFGKVTGLVVETGEGVTQIVPVYDGYITPAAMHRLDLAGEELTMYLQKLLSDAGYYVTNQNGYNHVQKMKEKFCYVALDFFKEEISSNLDVEYTLPDGTCLADGTTSVKLGVERFYCPEVLFDPRIIQRDSPSLTTCVWQSIQALSIEMRKSILNSIVLSGGTSLLPGFSERLEKEIKKMAPPQAKTFVRVQRTDDGVYGVWTGAKLFSERSSSSLFWITKAEWEEEGPVVVQRKTCLK